MKTLKAQRNFIVEKEHPTALIAQLLDGEKYLGDFVVRSLDDFYEEVYDQGNECAYIKGKIEANDGIYVIWGDIEILESYITKVTDREVTK